MSTEDPDRDAWIAAHGSERLRLALAHGLAGQSLGVDRDERLAHELPGWQWADRELKTSHVHTPSLASLLALAEIGARRDPALVQTELVKVRQGGTGPWREALVIYLSWGGRRAFRLVQP